MNLESTSFQNGKEIPRKHGYKFENKSPQLIISDAPKSTKSLAIIMDDPDAMAAVGKLWVHWVVWNIPSDTKIIKENTLPLGSILGRTDFGQEEYGGPAPPDKKHTYFFKLYALDTKLNLAKGSSKHDLEKAMKDHIIEQVTLTGTFKP